MTENSSHRQLSFFLPLLVVKIGNKGACHQNLTGLSNGVERSVEITLPNQDK